MPTDPPIACSLTAAELPERLAEMAAVGKSGLLSAETEDARAVLRFRAGTDVRVRLDAIVAADAQCCAFLRMELRDEADAVMLTIDAPEGAERLLADLVDAFGDREPAA